MLPFIKKEKLLPDLSIFFKEEKWLLLFTAPEKNLKVFLLKLNSSVKCKIKERIVKNYEKEINLCRTLKKKFHFYII